MNSRVGERITYWKNPPKYDPFYVWWSLMISIPIIHYVNASASWDKSGVGTGVIPLLISRLHLTGELGTKEVEL